MHKSYAHSEHPCNGKAQAGSLPNMGGGTPAQNGLFAEMPFKPECAMKVAVPCGVHSFPHPDVLTRTTPTQPDLTRLTCRTCVGEIS